ncbi:glutaredoxin-1, partial [Dichotomocladium elegans]
VEEQIKSNEVIVYSKTYCPYCKKAKKLLDQLGVKYRAVELNNEKNGTAIQDYLETRTGQRTVPNIFIKQQHVGGCDDLMAANANGNLQRMLAA